MFCIESSGPKTCGFRHLLQPSFGYKHRMIANLDPQRPEVLAESQGTNVAIIRCFFRMYLPYYGLNPHIYQDVDSMVPISIGLGSHTRGRSTCADCKLASSSCFGVCDRPPGLNEGVSTMQSCTQAHTSYRIGNWFSTLWSLGQTALFRQAKESGSVSLPPM